MTEEARNLVELLRDEDNSNVLDYIDDAADLIESLTAQLEQVEMERDGLNIMLSQAQAMLETRTKERDAAVRDMGMTAHCNICAHHRNNGGNCIGVSMCGEHRPRWQWRGMEVE